MAKLRLRAYCLVISLDLPLLLETRLCWPIQVQLLVPMLIVVTLGIVLFGLAGAHFAAVGPKPSRSRTFIEWSVR